MTAVDRGSRVGFDNDRELDRGSMESDVFGRKCLSAMTAEACQISFPALCDDRDDRARHGLKNAFDRGVWWKNA